MDHDQTRTGKFVLLFSGQSRGCRIRCSLLTFFFKKKKQMKTSTLATLASLYIANPRKPAPQMAENLFSNYS